MQPSDMDVVLKPIALPGILLMISVFMMQYTVIRLSNIRRTIDSLPISFAVIGFAWLLVSKDLSAIYLIDLSFLFALFLIAFWLIPALFNHRGLVQNWSKFPAWAKLSIIINGLFIVILPLIIADTAMTYVKADLQEFMRAKDAKTIEKANPGTH